MLGTGSVLFQKPTVDLDRKAQYRFGYRFKAAWGSLATTEAYPPTRRSGLKLTQEARGMVCVAASMGSPASL